MYNNDDTGEQMARAFLKSTGIFLGSFLPNIAFWIWIGGTNKMNLLLAMATLPAIAVAYLFTRKAFERYFSRNTLYHTKNLNVRRYALYDALNHEAWLFQAWFAWCILALVHMHQFSAPKVQFLCIILALVWLILLGNLWARYKVLLRQAIEQRREWHTQND